MQKREESYGIFFVKTKRGGLFFRSQTKKTINAPFRFKKKDKRGCETKKWVLQRCVQLKRPAVKSVLKLLIREMAPGVQKVGTQKVWTKKGRNALLSIT